MAEEQRNFGPGAFVHVYNRGVDKRSIFTDVYDRRRFVMALLFYAWGFENLTHFLDLVYQKEETSRITIEAAHQHLLERKDRANPLIELFAFALVENHYHLLIRILQAEGLSLFMQRFNNSYTKYFNGRHDRSGSLYGRRYQVVLVKTEEQLLHLARYLHLQSKDLAPIGDKKDRSQLLEFIRHYPWNSYVDYLGLRKSPAFNDLINRKFLLDYFIISDWQKQHPTDPSRDSQASLQDFVETYLDHPVLGVEDLALE